MADTTGAETSIEILYIKQLVARPPTLSSSHVPAEDLGLAGARLAVADSNTTGRFLGHSYQLHEVVAEDADGAVRAVERWLLDGSGLIVVDLPTSSLERVVLETAVVERGLLINAANTDDALRTTQCGPRILHSAPSRAMLADALAQWLIARRWRNWLLVRGERDEDIAYANAIKRAAKRFGGKVTDERVWSFNTDLRRTAQAELPLFTQGSDYDVVVVADELGDVGEFVAYNTWLPRPVVGTQGLSPTAWSPVIEQWGALQLQNRFLEVGHRAMQPEDYTSWLAVRAISEAVTRTRAPDPESVYTFLLSDQFELAAFKGRSLTFRPWNGQIRQPIPLVQPRAVVSQSPQEGFMHPRTELDTLGFDEAEVHCQLRNR